MTRIPVSIITGFLGAGKTTFLNRLLDGGSLDGAALIINEFGDIGIDHLLVERVDESIVELSGGCLCCAMRGDLADTLTKLLERPSRPDRVIIETTGLADPAPIAGTIVAHPVCQTYFELEAIIALVSAGKGEAILKEHGEARQQIALSDRILLTKTDIAAPQQNLPEALASLNPSAPIHDVNSVSKPPTVWLQADRGSGLQLDGRSAIRNHTHAQSVGSVSLTAQHPLHRADLDIFLHGIVMRWGNDLLRVKGLVQLVDEAGPLVVQGVGTVFEQPYALQQWPDQSRKTRLVVIARNLDERAVRDLFSSLCRTPRPDTADRQALTQNPLAPTGFF
ncbi:MAG: GTP-binding protein [Ahrensia sp.]|nr:GTP-binding protein [Ahrensia sp.]